MESIIVFGKGKYYQKKEKELLKNYIVDAFIDNAILLGKVAESPIDGINTYNPEVIKKWEEKKVCIMSKQPFEMCKQLLQFGVSEKNIIFGQNMQPNFDEHESLLWSKEIKYLAKNGTFCIQYHQNIVPINNIEDLKNFNRDLYASNFKEIKYINELKETPVSREWGINCGTPIDRYYIDRFICNNKKFISGDVMEIADNYYTLKYGNPNVKSHIMHVKGWGKDIIKGNLETGEGIISESMDCLICTQTIQMIYDIFKVPKNIYKLLKKGGTALITAHGISQLSLYDYTNWGEYWRFTQKTLQRMFGNVFGEENVVVRARGNVKVAVAMLYGLALEDLDSADLEYDDEQYQVLIEVVVHKV